MSVDRIEPPHGETLGELEAAAHLVDATLHLLDTEGDRLPGERRRELVAAAAHRSREVVRLLETLDDGRDPQPTDGDPVADEADQVLDRLPLGVLVIDETTHAVRYANRQGVRWQHVVTPSGFATSEAMAAGPWSDAHLNDVATELSVGEVTELLAAGVLPDQPAAEVRWHRTEGVLVAVLRELRADEAEALALGRLDPAPAPGGLDRGVPVDMDALCDRLVTRLAGDRRPLVLDRAGETSVVRGDPDLLTAAIEHVVDRALARGREGAPVVLRLVQERHSVVVEIDEHGDVPVAAVPDDASEEEREPETELGASRRLAAAHGGRVTEQELGTLSRTRLRLPQG
jgi:hypothetical protein